LVLDTAARAARQPSYDRAARNFHDLRRRAVLASSHGPTRSVINYQVPRGAHPPPVSPLP
jgi:hypothetical protein